MLGDPRFFQGRGPFTLAEVARAAGADLPAGVEAAVTIARPAPLDAAGPDAVTFLEHRRYAARLAESRAGACLLRADDAARAPAGMVALVVREPTLAWARVLRLFFPEPPCDGGIDPRAAVDPGALLGRGVAIRAFASVAARAAIGEGTVIGEGAVIGHGVVLGAGCRVGPGASVTHAIIGDGVVIGAGARIGGPGFGFTPGPRGFEPVPQLGRVLIGDHAAIGANTTVDRGSGGDTVIGAFSRIDNLVQVAHNCRLGRGCVLAGQVGLSGSTILEDGVMLGGQAGSAGHLRVGARARVGAQAGIMGDVPAGAEVIGSPAQPKRQMWRALAVLNRLAASGAARDGAGAADTA